MSLLSSDELQLQQC